MRIDPAEVSDAERWATIFKPLTVEDEKADAFLAIAGKTQDFYSGYVRLYLCRGKEYQVDTRYDPEVIAIGILPL